MNNLVLGMTFGGQTSSPICRFVSACVGASALYCGLRRLVSSDTWTYYTVFSIRSKHTGDMGNTIPPHATTVLVG